MINLQSVLASITNSTYIAVDTETDGLNVRKNAVIGLGIQTDSGDAYYASELSEIKLILNLLTGKKLVFWNAYFDLEMIVNNFGYDLWDSLYCDVILLKHSVDEEMPFKLKEVAANILGHSALAEKEEMDASVKANGGKKGQVWLADPAIIAKYCLQDCNLTMKLFNYYSKLCTAEGMDKFFYEDETMPLYKSTTRYLQSRGVRVDLPLLTKLNEEIVIDIADLKSRIFKELDSSGALNSFKSWYVNKNFKPARTGVFAQQLLENEGVAFKRAPSGKFVLSKSVLAKSDHNPAVAWLLDKVPFIHNSKLDHFAIIRGIQETLWSKEVEPFNLSSKLHLKKVFFDQLGEKPLTKTKLGSPQINDDFLKIMSEKYEWVKLLRQYNKLIKIKGSYFERILEKHEDGIYYPSYFQHRTVSGRYGSDFQQLNRKMETGPEVVKKYNNEIRNIFISRPGSVFVEADYESLEPKVFSHVSNEEKIRDIFKCGDDFYSIIAISTENLSNMSANKNAPNYLGTVDKSKRQAAKVYALGIPYGLESFSLSHKLGITQDSAERLIQKYFAGFPALHAWFKKCDTDFIKYGISTSETGRKRHLKKQQAALRQLGIHNLDSLELWKNFHGSADYEDKKKTRKFIKNAINNFKNFQIQSLAASITNRACIAIQDQLKFYQLNAYIVMQVHDSITIECEEKDVKIVGSILQYAMENTYKISVPLLAIPTIANRLGDMK
jgi:DNA polymerase I-like protein with 3'-5' exonuclease and polymerase domains